MQPIPARCSEAPLKIQFPKKPIKARLFKTSTRGTEHCFTPEYVCHHTSLQFKNNYSTNSNRGSPISGKYLSRWPFPSYFTDSFEHHFSPSATLYLAFYAFTLNPIVLRKRYDSGNRILAEESGKIQLLVSALPLTLDHFVSILSPHVLSAFQTLM